MHYGVLLLNSLFCLLAELKIVGEVEHVHVGIDRPVQ